jgi:thiamine kinase-like enzyme
MELDEVERLGRDVVPGVGNLAVEPVSAGGINQMFRVVRDRQAYALRVAGEQRGFFQPDPAWEAQVLAIAGEARLAPPLVHADRNRRVLLSRWIKGSSWSVSQTRTPANIGKIAALLRQLHALPAPARPREMSPASWIAAYDAALSLRKKIRVDTGLKEEAASRLERLALYPRTPGVLCHGDLHIRNLLQRGSALVLLDWEYAHVTDPFWDLAGWSANNDFGQAARGLLLASYLPALPHAAEQERLALLTWLYDYVCLLWSLLYLDSRRDPTGAIAARATQLDARLRIPAH